MDVLANHAKRIAALEAAQGQIVQEAIVNKIHAEDNLVDVEVRGETLEKVPYQTLRAGPVGKTYWAPEEGESGLLFCPGGDVGNAVFQPAINTEDNPPPDDAEGKLVVDVGEDGTIVLKIGMTRLELSSTAITGYIAGVGKLQLTAAGANVGGATFLNGSTNLANGGGPVAYPPVAIS